MTKAQNIRTRVLALAADYDPNTIAGMLDITAERVERILDLADVPHEFPAIEAGERPETPRLYANAPHGTDGGYLRHRNIDRTRPCEECREAHLLHEREAVGRVHERTRKPCGTLAAHSRHKRNGQEPCDACKAARAEYARSQNAARAANKEEFAA